MIENLHYDTQGTMDGDAWQDRTYETPKLELANASDHVFKHCKVIHPGCPTA